MTAASDNSAQQLRASVIVCAYNEEQRLGEVLQALSRQSLPDGDYEVVIVDDESSDRTAEIAEAFVKACENTAMQVTYARIRHQGLSAARNAGITLSRAPVLAYIDGDAIPAPSWLRELIRPFEDPDVGLCGGGVDLLNTDSRVAALAQVIRHRQVFTGPAKQNAFIGCNMAIRRTVFDALGGFHNCFTSRGDEVTLYQRALQRGVTYAAAPGAVVKHERPDSLGEWLRVEWQSKTLAPLVDKAIGRAEPTRMRGALRLAKGFVYTAILPSVALSRLHPAWAGILVAALGLLLVDTFGRRRNRDVYAELAENYPALQAMLGWVTFKAVDAGMLSWGYVVGCIQHAGARPSPPVFDRDSITRERHSRPR